MLTHSVAELWKVYRLMVFNYLIGNKDDHAKNFAFIYRDGDCILLQLMTYCQVMASMAFALLQSMIKSSQQKKDLFAVAIKAGLNEQEADVVFSRIDTIVRQKEDVVANCMR